MVCAWCARLCVATHLNLLFSLLQMWNSPKNQTNIRAVYHLVAGFPGDLSHLIEEYLELVQKMVEKHAASSDGQVLFVVTLIQAHLKMVSHVDHDACTSVAQRTVPAAALVYHHRALYSALSDGDAESHVLAHDFS